MASNVRATRSRFSSPAQPPAQQNGTLETPKEKVSEASKSFMSKWLEPSVQKKASYEEAGLVKAGVLEGMAPLGAMPKSKKTPGDNASGIRKIILRPSAWHAANAPKSPHEVAPAPTLPASSSPPPVPAAAPATSPPRRKLPSAVIDDDEDDDYEPTGKSVRRRQSGRVSKGKKPSPPSAPQPSAPRASAARPPPPLTIDPEVKDFTDKVVEAAVDEALRHNRYPTAYALRMLYDERSTEPGFVAMIEDVFSQTADADTVTEFASMVEEKKREGKKGNQGCYYFVPPATSTRATPRKAKPAPYARMLKHANSDAQQQGDSPRAAKKIKITHSRTPSKSTQANGITKVKTPGSRKRNRRGSGSSDSSLSTTLSLSPLDTHGKKSVAAPMQSPVSPSTRGAPISATNGAQTSTATTAADIGNDAPNTRPITTRGKTLAASASKTKSMSNATESNSPSTNPPHHHRSSRHSQSGRSHKPAAVDTSMPGRVSAVNLFPNLPRKSSHTPPEETVDVEDHGKDDDGFWDRKWKAKQASNDYSAEHSYMRASSPPERHATPTMNTRKTRQSLLPNIGTRSTRSASKRPNDENDETISPTAPSWIGDASSTVGSRAATPASVRPPKKARTGIRIKLSPIKKKGAAGGLPRPVGEAQSAPNGASREQTTDNDEYCSACGNAGDVLCCDGCPRSFHFECVDMAQDELPDEWYCNECLIRRFPSRVPVHKGVFGSALNNLEKCIPRAFSLPKKLQNRFEGVKAGSDGDYEEVISKQVRDRKRNVADESADWKTTVDGQVILCHNCQKGSDSFRDLAGCTYCPLWWHLHCLDPPAAHLPNTKNWRCPAHTDDVAVEAHALAPAHRFRRIKGSQAITPALPRGLKNNGQIELDWADEPEPSRTGWPDPKTFGRTYKLPVKGVILDFIEQLRHKGAGYGPRQEQPKWIQASALPPPDSNAALKGSTLDRSLAEMQASLTLTSLQQDRSQPVQQMTSALLSSVDINILSVMAKANADNIEVGKLTDDDRLGLRATLMQMDAMSTRIRKILGEENNSAASALASPGATSVAEVTPSSSPREKMHSLAPMTEPTPPSTVDQGDGSMDID